MKVKCCLCKIKIDKENAFYWGILKKYYCKACYKLYIGPGEEEEWRNNNIN